MGARIQGFQIQVSKAHGSYGLGRRRLRLEGIECLEMGLVLASGRKKLATHILPPAPPSAS